jgi:hypothetical protein
LQRMKLLPAPNSLAGARLGSRSAIPRASLCTGSGAQSTGLRQRASTLTRRKAKSRRRPERSEDQRPDWIERERNGCAEPKGGGCTECVTGICARAAGVCCEGGVCAEREGGVCAGRAAARARLFASYRPTMHPVAAPNIVGQRPARCSPRDDMPRPT